MVIDTSALLSILFEEDDSVELADRISEAASRRISAVNFVEAGVVADSNPNKLKGRMFDQVVLLLGIAIEPTTAEEAYLAREAYRRYGKGRHGARLNLGDCFAYALSKATGEPLLYKGEDFAQTDIEPAR